MKCITMNAFLVRLSNMQEVIEKEKVALKQAAMMFRILLLSILSRSSLISGLFVTDRCHVLSVMSKPLICMNLVFLLAQGCQCRVCLSTSFNNLKVVFFFANWCHAAAVSLDISFLACTSSLFLQIGVMCLLFYSRLSATLTPFSCSVEEFVNSIFLRSLATHYRLLSSRQLGVDLCFNY